MRVESTGQAWNGDRASPDDGWGGPPALIEPLAASVTVTVGSGGGVKAWAVEQGQQPLVQGPPLPL